MVGWGLWSWALDKGRCGCRCFGWDGGVEVYGGDRIGITEDGRSWIVGFTSASDIAVFLPVGIIISWLVNTG
jgi:hypothetical protein